MDAGYLIAESRALLRLSGPDLRTFLQGLVSNDVTKAGPERAIYAALLTPQGRYLHDFFIAQIGGAFYLDAEAGRQQDLARRLARYRLRSQVAIEEAPAGWRVALLFGPAALARLGLPPEPGRAAPFPPGEGAGAVFVDPRLAALGARAILPAGAAAALEAAGFAPAAAADYERLRLSLGVPDGSRDLPVEKAILLENGLDELNAIDWRKGCYMGQELTARTRYRGLVRKRLMPVRIEGPLPPPGTPVRLGEREVGELRSGAEGIGLALLRLESLAAAGAAGGFRAGEARLTPYKPDWAAF